MPKSNCAVKMFDEKNIHFYIMQPVKNTIRMIRKCSRDIIEYKHVPIDVKYVLVLTYLYLILHHKKIIHNLKHMCIYRKMTRWMHWVV